MATTEVFQDWDSPHETITTTRTSRKTTTRTSTTKTTSRLTDDEVRYGTGIPNDSMYHMSNCATALENLGSRYIEFVKKSRCYFTD